MIRTQSLGASELQNALRSPRATLLGCAGGARGEGLEESGFGSRKQKSRFQLRAPRAAVASSGLPDFPPRPAPPLPGAGSGVPGGLILERGREHGGERQAVAAAGGGEAGTLLAAPPSLAEPPRARLSAEQRRGRDAGLPGPCSARGAVAGARELSTVLKRRRRQRQGRGPGAGSSPGSSTAAARRGHRGSPAHARSPSPARRRDGPQRDR